MAKLTDYSAVTRLTSNNIFIVDGSGTKKITAGNAAAELAGLVSATEHRNTFRGKNLGATVTQAQKTAISNGSFDDLFIGDYWTIGDIQWTIADMDYFYQTGDTPALTKHHLVMVPNKNLYNAQMNDSNTTEGGYVLSKMYTEGLNQAKETINTAFSNMVLTHKEYLVNAVKDGAPSGGGWFESTVELMNEIMVYGCPILAPASTGTVSVSGYTVGKQQLALFALNPKAANIRIWYWLRDVRSASAFCAVTGYGDATDFGASVSGGVRPYFLIG